MKATHWMMTACHRSLRITACSLLAFTAARSAEPSNVDVWYDAQGQACRVSVRLPHGQTRVVEIDTAAPHVWQRELKALGIDTKLFGTVELPETDKLGPAHQLMRTRGFDRNALPGDSFYYHFDYGHIHGYPFPFQRGHGHYCRPHQPRRHPGLTIRF